MRVIGVGCLLAALVFSAALLSNCAGGPETDAQRLARWEKGQFTSFELENGIGPVKQKIQLGEINESRVARGEELFEQRCFTCHLLDGKKTGPPLRDVATRKSPEYILNQILNPDQMGKLHPEGKRLVAQYMQYMTIMGITYDDARALLDYLRSEAEKPPVSAATPN